VIVPRAPASPSPPSVSPAGEESGRTLFPAQPHVSPGKRVVAKPVPDLFDFALTAYALALIGPVVTVAVLWVLSR
jgi:hypothetical protein